MHIESAGCRLLSQKLLKTSALPWVGSKNKLNVELGNQHVNRFDLIVHSPVFSAEPSPSVNRLSSSENEAAAAMVSDSDEASNNLKIVHHLKGNRLRELLYNTWFSIATSWPWHGSENRISILVSLSEPCDVKIQIHRLMFNRSGTYRGILAKTNVRSTSIIFWTNAENLPSFLRSLPPPKHKLKCLIDQASREGEWGGMKRKRMNWQLITLKRSDLKTCLHE